MTGIMFDHEDLLQPKQVFIEPINYYAQVVEQRLGEFLLPFQPGVYTHGSVTPVLHANRRYFVQKKTDNGLELFPIDGDLSKITDNIVDDSGNIILSSNFMKNKQMYLSNHPTIPNRGLEIIKCLVDHHLANVSRWSESRGYKNRLCSFFNSDDAVDQVIDDGLLEEICSPLLMRINQFIDEDEWSIYFTRLVAVDLKIEKCIDYRIYEWTVNKRKNNHQND